jgi:hypothetical protein
MTTPDVAKAPRVPRTQGQAKNTPRTKGDPLPTPATGLRRAARICGYLTLIAAGSPLVLLPFGGGVALGGAILGGILTILMGVCTLGCLWQARDCERHAAAFRRGECLVHWTYTRGEWLRFAISERQRVRGEVTGMPWVGLIVGLLFGAIIGLYQGSWVLGVALGGVAGIFFWLLGGLMELNAEGRSRRRRAKVSDTWIGCDAAFYDDKYLRWGYFGCRLGGAVLLPGDPAVLELTLRVFNPDGDDYSQEHRIPVPAGREGEAEQLIRVLTGAVPGKGAGSNFC